MNENVTFCLKLEYVQSVVMVKKKSNQTLNQSKNFLSLEICDLWVQKNVKISFLSCCLLHGSRTM